MTSTVREFIRQSYRLISANSPTVPLHGDDQKLGIRILNQLLKSYSSSGILLTIGKTVVYTLPANQPEVTYGDASVIPVPDVTEGRLSNLDSAWLESEGVTYPLVDKSRDVFFASFKYDPLAGLPRFVIVLFNNATTTLRLYPAASKEYTLNVRGKFELATLTANDDLSNLPDYFERFLLLAVARDMSLFKGRMDAWTDKLESRYVEAKLDMEASSEVNLSITGDNEALLNGAWRVRAGV